MSRWLAERATYLGRARMAGRLYRLGSYPGVVQCESGVWVTGDVFHLTKAMKTLDKLDRYEGCSRGQSLNPLFVRREVEIFPEDQESLIAWVYLYNRNVSRFPLIPGGDFLALPGLARARQVDR